MVRKTSWARALLALSLLTGTLVPFAGGTAHAVGGLPVACTAAGTVFWSQVGNTTSWSLLGKGSCQGDLEGTYFLDFTGAGTSDSAGLCDGSGLVQNLKINIVGTLTNAGSLAVKGINNDWVAPLSTYPVVTPFLVESNGGDLLGAGAFFNHIFLQCTNSPVAQFDFVYQA
jgi:hypothetical protein